MVDPIVPVALRKGDTVAFVSPSARLNDITPAALARAKTHFEKLGYKVKVIFKPTKDVTFPEITALRCEELHSAFRDPEINAIVCTSGGAHANELLPHLDYELIRSNPKIFVGYSDITRLHYGIFMNTGLQTFYGPCAITEFGESPEPFSFTTNHFLHVLRDSVDKPAGQVPQSKEWAEELPDFLLNEPDSQKPRKMTPNPGWKWLRPGKATGRITGGCLTSIGNAKGTRYFPTSHHGKILFLENAMGEKATSPVSLADTRSWLADLVHTGIFEQIVGLVIGRPYAHDEEMKKLHDRIVLEQLEGTTFPILTDVDVGHTDPIITIPLNVLVSLDSEKDEFSFLEAAVRRNE